MARVLIFERSPGLRRDLDRAIRNAGYEVDALGDYAQVASRIASHGCRAAIIEVADRQDLDLVERLAEAPSRPAVFAMGSSPSVELAVASMKRGAMEYLRKPFRIELLENALSNALEPPLLGTAIQGGLIGEDPVLRSLIAQAKSAASSDATILIAGESGTGKHQLARYIHRLSRRRRGPFVVVDCASLTDSGGVAELFGRQRDLRRDGTGPQAGLIASADGGSLVFDLVDEASKHIQQALLRFLQEREVTAVGSRDPRTVDVRIIATSRQDLRVEASEGRFREDLYYRLDVVVLNLPPLRERPNDIYPIATAFLARHALNAGCELPQLTRLDIVRLVAQPFRGNLVELDNLMRRAVVLFPDRPIEMDRLLCNEHVGLPEVPSPVSPLNLRDLEREAVKRSLEETKGNRTHASELLGINVRTLRNKIRAYGFV